MTTKDEALKLALEAMEGACGSYDVPLTAQVCEAIEACRAALAEQDSEPVTNEIVGCFDAAFSEGLAEALAETTDLRLRDLVERRLLYAYTIIDKEAPQPKQDSEPLTVPQGWKLVPVEPTPEMIKAAADAWFDCGSKLFFNKALFAVRAAIVAAPQATAPQPLTDEQIENIASEHWLYPRRFAHAIEAAHGIGAQKEDV